MAAFGVWEKPEEDSFHLIYTWGETENGTIPKDWKLVKEFETKIGASNYCVNLNEEYERQKSIGAK